VIDVVFHRDSRGRLSSFFASGHAEFAIDADDLVCAAVSAILQATQLGLEVYAKVKLEARRRPGELLVIWPEGSRDDERVRAIATTAQLAISQLMRQYPEHVRLSVRDESPETA
jgi:uncharacterized protein YsxB (DUF464 family)